MKKTLLSGMRPTGPMHLGHLLGALANWTQLQEKYDCYYMVADWHALMSEYADPSAMPDCIHEMVADWIASGVDPKKAVIFRQSDVKEHLELYMILSLIVPLPWLERCPTYKEQLREVKGRDLTTYGFLGYPVLQAADIILYKAAAVPIGIDQVPHLELTREIVRRFNGMYKEIFPEPEALLTKVPKLLGADRRKMSKSYKNFIALGETPDVIGKKVLSMITDPERIKLSDKGHPDICNVFSYYKVFKPDMEGEVKDWCENAKLGCIDCKKRLSEALAEYLKPFCKKRQDLLKDRGYIDKILKQGAEKASSVTSKTIGEVYKAMGIR
ncbi:MAG: tryptophan--tRNA ligase [Candidatus Omnitrophica bacterium]|nr:tryptophan--tRNA ligase [Candidatus Omnitrophota bacterium]